LANKNRTVVKDGRIQVKKKRTDRSYLQPEASPPAPPVTETEGAPVDAPEPVAAGVATESVETDAAPALVPSPVVEPDPVSAFTTPPPPPAPAPAAVVPAAAATAPAAPRTGAARALQQQGVRKRREVDVNELARRDSSYAMHELRRIAILAVMVVAALIVLAVVLR
jgi:hypothetical protein